VPNSLSAKKRVRQNATRRERNRARKSVLKSDVRKLGDAIHDKKADEARQLLRIVAKRIDQNAAKGTIHRNTAARRKSRLAKRVNKLAAT
jgi:small subunit ribosomal protein S20